ncbi:hypothetical protein GKZ90_0001440 [Flavobacterium sp. MC2016-06]|jgi:hypothetical protein|uniref:hypothetical protein n=1 Tax=Flavobacterium sp. MC2016-06 TaxID=2676308 RepID=UPI0012BAB9F9|nr:hypothetical protein [Flavobacterium sp. MC2016-06]MBU3859024.1 hypothetical protein [Flavobacterium sp. MC2016-06]
MKTLKFILSFIVLFSIFGCKKKVEKIKTPTFIFTYQDAKINYSLRYLGKDTLYLSDIKSNKNYLASINTVSGNELSRIINGIDKPEYLNSYQSKSTDDVVYRFLILHNENTSESLTKNENADQEIYDAAKKLNDIRNELNFVLTDKEQ